MKHLIVTGVLISFFLIQAGAQTIEFESSSSKGRENKTPVVMTLTRSVPHGGPSSVDYTVTGTATGNGVDYVLFSGTATFNPGDKTNEDIVAIIVDDFLDEPDETIIITLSNPQDATLGEKTVFTYTIEDDDKPGDAKGKISVSCYPEEVTYGKVITFCVEIAENPLPIGTIGMDFVFDQTEYAFLGMTAGSLSSDWTIIEGIQETPGKIKIEAQAGAGSFIPELSSGSLVNISLQTKCLDLPTDTESTLAIDNYIYDLTDTFLPEPVQISLIIRPCPSLGDINGDGRVTPGDAQGAFSIFLGQITPGFCQVSTSDTNCNGSTSPGDAQAIFNQYLGKVSLPECCEEYVSSSSFTIQQVSMEPREIHERRKLFPLSTAVRPGEFLALPIIITRPKGVRSFRFDLIYPGEALTYLGLRKSPMTSSGHIEGIPAGDGFLRIEGQTPFPIGENILGSLAVVLFKVNKLCPDRLALEVHNPEGDIADAEISKGIVTRLEDSGKEPNTISLGKTRVSTDNTVKVPVFINHVSAISAFGMECEYSHDRLEYLGIEPVGLAEDFLVLEGNLLEKGRFRVGAFNISPIQASSKGILCEIVFLMKEKGGLVSIVDLVDDIQDYSVLVPTLFID